jgi:hypothetical protein
MKYPKYSHNNSIFQFFAKIAPSLKVDPDHLIDSFVISWERPEVATNVAARALAAARDATSRLIPAH